MDGKREQNRPPAFTVAARHCGKKWHARIMRQELSAQVLEKHARYLLSIACLVKDAAKHDELQQRAQELLGMAEGARNAGC